MRVKYVGIRVMDLDRSLRFYGSLLGLREVHRGDLSAYGRGTFVHMEDPGSGQRIELNWYPEGSMFATPYTPGDGLDHIGVVVDDLEKTTESMLAAGARPTSVTLASSNGHQVCLLDPDGNWIELYEESPPPRASPARRGGTRRPPTPGKALRSSRKATPRVR
jgi:lactoylglutathione lyase